MAGTRRGAATGREGRTKVSAAEPGARQGGQAAPGAAFIGLEVGGRYRLEEVVGRGASSTVYRAFDVVLARVVAVKLMHLSRAQDANQLERFRREARAMARLVHPHIVSVIDAGEQELGGECGGGEGDSLAPYIVFEYVQGETLGRRIRREGPLEIQQALAYAIEIGRGLQAAHEQGIVHRDVKPQNVLLSEEGGAKISDFGIARTLSEEGLTLGGRVLATTDYVSPEQALGEPVTGQSDVYSLGVVLFEMLTGTLPFKGPSPVAVAMRHVREELPDVQTLRPDVSAATAAVVERATAKDLSRRYATARALVEDLEEVLAVETSRAGQAAGEATAVLRTVPAPTRERVPWRLRYSGRFVATVLVLAVLLLAGVLVFVLSRTQRGTGVPPTAAAPPHLRAVSLAQTAAHSYNPFGTGPEHQDEASNAIDGDPNTAWSTEHYVNGQLGKPGVGLYVDASPGVAARALSLQSPTPGFTAAVYGSDHLSESPPYGDSTPLAERGWRLLAGARTIAAQTVIRLSTANQRYRYYLVWITRLQNERAQGGVAAQIAQLTLFR